MTYEKPAVVEVAGVIEAVQTSTLKMHQPLDVADLVTVSAYQADES